MMEAFDTPVPDRPEPARQTTTIAPQALILLNSEFAKEQASAFAELLLKDTGATNETICRAAFRRALARDPVAKEIAVLSELLRRFSDESTGGSRRAAVEQLARLILNLNEFIYID